PTLRDAEQVTSSQREDGGCRQCEVEDRHDHQPLIRVVRRQRCYCTGQYDTDDLAECDQCRYLRAPIPPSAAHGPRPFSRDKNRSDSHPATRSEPNAATAPVPVISANAITACE